MTASVFPLDDFLKDKGYPGFRPDFVDSPWAVEPLRPFSKEDEERFWFLNFHVPRGVTPMGFVWVADCFDWGTQFAAEQMPLPNGRGLTSRLGGTFQYASTIPVDSDWDSEQRVWRLSRSLPAFLENFDAIWESRVEEMTRGLDYLEQFETGGRSLEELRQFLVDARRFQRRAWEIHFEMTYPLLANYVAFYGVCDEFGIDTGEISKFLQGRDNKIMQCDRELWDLTQLARSQGIDTVFRDNDAAAIDGALRATAKTQHWLGAFDKFLAEFGHRTDTVHDVTLASWIEDTTPPLGMIKTFLNMDKDHDFGDAHQQAVDERDAALDNARSRLSLEEQRVFDAALESCKKANFAWWNEEHNYYIDLRATIPLRKACLAVGTALDAETPGDAVFLFWPELMSAIDGDTKWQSYRSLISERKDYFKSWTDRRFAVSKVVGHVPDDADDPILLEIFGHSRNFFAALRDADREVAELTGVPASSGSVRGRARVLVDESLLHAIQPGEILVCDGTTPSWTPVFAKIAACVCDGGGTLTHASIISREYRIPCVVGVGTATKNIRTNDEIEVDGTTGRVRILSRSPTP